MKASTFALVLLAGVSLGLAGCETVSDLGSGVRQQFEPTYHAAVVPLDKKAVYEAARQAAVGLGFRLTGGGPAQGRFDAVGKVTADDTLRGATQLVMKVTLDEVGAGTKVSMLILEDVQSDSQGPAGLVTETPLQDSALYGAFFNALNQPPAPRAP